MDKLSLLEKFSDPEIMQSLSMGEKMLASLYVMFLGMLVTFVALCILWGLIVIMSKMIHGTKKEAVKVVTTPAPVSAPAPAELEKEEDEELVAVITAAIAASLQTSTHNIIVRNITRVSDVTPAWGRMGRMEQMNNNF
ncbi:OadG family protein [Crassaminicella profunda]|uniref:OadG family protein n=1 Tax=Crassaminicella profunda TaxID=1286698 RepID=UPI001CA74FE4|nr:OadG family protein [Crassaminicella profunda]QZY54711.1 OadG family protein [Crassaminicella profunda]